MVVEKVGERCLQLDLGEMPRCDRGGSGLRLGMCIGFFLLFPSCVNLCDHFCILPTTVTTHADNGVGAENAGRDAAWAT